MSVNSVSGSTLKRDLITVLQQARAAATQKVDTTSAFAAASQDTATQSGTDSTAAASDTAKSTGTAATPALSNDLMASLLQLQSDFSQAGLQNGLAATGDTTSATDSSTATTGAESDQAANGAAPVHHHHGHHARSPETDATADTQSGTTGTDAAATASTTEAASGSDTADGLQAFLQQVTKAITAYATGGPAGVAAAALTTTAKA